MHRRGHVGAALLLYAPAGAALSRAGEPALSLLGAAVAVAVSTLPDADEFGSLPVDHRGPTHTVWFVAGGAAVAAAAGYLCGAAVDRPVTLAATAGGATALSLLSHLLADSITPMGIRPFYPVSGWHHSFDLTLSANPRANATVLLVGALAALVGQAAALL